jgi:pyridoxal phosphate enzyme (YggS family)
MEQYLNIDERLNVNGVHFCTVSNSNCSGFSIGIQNIDNMPVDKDNYEKIIALCRASGATLVAVSKTKPIADIRALYALGQRHFGENYVQELVEKQPQMPEDTCWHFIGHLQSNKVKYIAPFVHLIHGVDSFKLLKEINKQGAKHNRVIDVLLQIHIAQEETKFGLNAHELDEILHHPDLPTLHHVCIRGLMGMASFSNDTRQVQQEFKYLKSLFDKASQLRTANCELQILSMGMSGDYELALACGSTMVRIGSLLFGARG